MPHRRMTAHGYWNILCNSLRRKKKKKPGVFGTLKIFANLFEMSYLRT
jgi:hypothetical protein